MLLKKYNKFFEDTHGLSVDERFLDFVDRVKECNDGSSYSNLAKDRGINFDPEEDFAEIDEKMSENGWDQTAIKGLIDEMGQSTFNAMVDNAYPSQCGSVDYYLYKLTNGEFKLSGMDWSDFMGEENMTFSGDALENELLIKFGYGWHNTKYGKLIIEQNLGSVEKFVQVAKEQVPIYILRQFAHIVSYTQSRSKNKSELKIMDIKSNTNGVSKAWMEPFLYMDGTFYVLLDDLYEIAEPHFIRPLSYEQFARFVEKALDRMRDEGNRLQLPLFGKVKYTRYEDELRISL